MSAASLPSSTMRCSVPEAFDHCPVLLPLVAPVLMLLTGAITGLNQSGLRTATRCCIRRVALDGLCRLGEANLKLAEVGKRA